MMPLFEFRCRACGHEFEALVRQTTPSCPSCQRDDLERLPSMFAVDSEATRGAARQASLPRSRERQFEREKGEREDFDRHH